MSVTAAEVRAQADALLDLLQRRHPELAPLDRRQLRGGLVMGLQNAVERMDVGPDVKIALAQHLLDLAIALSAPDP